MAEWIDQDRGWRSIVKAIFDQDFVEVTVGVHGDEDPYLRGQDEPATVPQIASFHEYGAKRGEPGEIPERSFLRSTVDEQLDSWTGLMVRIEGAVATKRMSIGRGLNVLGLKMQADVQRKIQTGPFEPNAPSTIKAKGSSKPLIDTGRLRQSITYKIVGVSTAGKRASGLWAYRDKGGEIKIGK